MTDVATPRLSPMAAPPLPQRMRRAVVVVVGQGSTARWPVARLLRALRELGVETIYAGAQDDGARIAAIAAAVRADAVEICIAGCGGVRVLRELLRELIALDRGSVSIVIHRVE